MAYGTGDDTSFEQDAAAEGLDLNCEIENMRGDDAYIEWDVAASGFDLNSEMN